MQPHIGFALAVMSDDELEHALQTARWAHPNPATVNGPGVGPIWVTVPTVLVEFELRGLPAPPPVGWRLACGDGA